MDLLQHREGGERLDARSARFAAVVRRFGLDERALTSPTGGRPR